MARRKKHRDSWGSIAQVSDDSWRIRYWSEDGDGYRRRSKTVRGTRRDAERERSRLMLAHSEDAPCPTVGEVWEQWALPAYERRMSEGSLAVQSLRSYRSAWDRHVSARWADVPCDMVRALDVQRWLDGLTYNPAIISMATLRPTLDFAVRFGVIETNPFREKYLMPHKSTAREMDKGVWDYAQLGDIWRLCALGTWWEAAFLALAFGGLRVGEALGLRSEDVSATDVDGISVCALSVRRQVLNTGRQTTDVLKNPQSVRTVGVPGLAGERMLDLAGSTTGWLSGDGTGRPTTQARLNRTWKAAADGADGIELHPIRNLRNSFETNTRWVLDVPPWILEPILGHAGKGVTGQYYDRPSEEMLVSAIARAHAAKPYDAKWGWATRSAIGTNWDQV